MEKDPRTTGHPSCQAQYRHDSRSYDCASYCGARRAEYRKIPALQPMSVKSPLREPHGCHSMVRELSKVVLSCAFSEHPVTLGLCHQLRMISSRLCSRKLYNPAIASSTVFIRFFHRQSSTTTINSSTHPTNTLFTRSSYEQLPTCSPKSPLLR